jgi:hypothetical protein
MTSSVTLNKLINFVPKNEMERYIFTVNKKVLETYFRDTKESWSKGRFYLGGQLPMYLDEELTISKFHNVREIQRSREIYMCNGFELASVEKSKRELIELEIIFQKYREIYKLRMTNILYATCLKSDLSDLIISYLL